MFRGETTLKETGVTDLKHVGEKVKRFKHSAQHWKNKIDLCVLETINIVWQLNKDYRKQMNKYSDSENQLRNPLKITYKVLW
jgi:hypothetical protein